MHTLIRWLGIIVGAATLTVLLFTVFSYLFAPNTALQSFPLRVNSSVIVFSKATLEKEPVSYTPKRPVRRAPLIGPVPVVTCVLPVGHPPEQLRQELETPKPNFELPRLSLITDSDPPACPDGSPLIRRVAPIMPENATKSGHCTLEFQLAGNGYPFNVKIKFCSEEIFTKPSIKAVQRWLYSTCNQDGDFTTTTHNASVTYLLTDESGDIIPE
jgi:Gram-negative bacterial TonB protein C-terminal